MAQILIGTLQISGEYDKWGIKVYEYSMPSGTTRYTNMDLQDLVTRIGTKRAASIEKEVRALSVKMKKRNQELEYLSSVMSVMGSLNSQFTEDDKSPKGFNYDSKFLEGCKIASDGNYQIINDVLWVSISATWYPFSIYGTSQSMGKANCELLLQTAKAKVDSLNNASQLDMTKLQSLVTKRDESYSTATSLSTNVAETRSNLIKNF